MMQDEEMTENPFNIKFIMKKIQGVNAQWLKHQLLVKTKIDCINRKLWYTKGYLLNIERK